MLMVEAIAPISSSKETEAKTKSVLVFSGQGTQFVGMGRKEFETYDFIKRIYNQADEILGYRISEVSFSGPEEKLNETFYTQPALYVFKHINTLLYQRSINGNFEKPEFLAGHSFGEYNSLILAGCLSFEDGLRLVQKRAEVSKMACDANPGGMMIVRANWQNSLLLEGLKKFVMDICVVNTDELVTVGGKREVLEEAKNWFSDNGFKRTEILPISGAFHSRLMEPAVPHFAKAVRDANIRNAEIPIIANTTARPIMSKEDIEKELIDHLTMTVRWREIVTFLEGQGINQMVEIGGKVLSTINKRNCGGDYKILDGPVLATVWSKD